MRCFSAPAKAPRSWPDSSLSIKCSLIASQSTRAISRGTGCSQSGAPLRRARSTLSVLLGMRKESATREAWATMAAKETNMKPTPEGWPRISTSLYYEDAPAAIDWLCKAFGFEVRIRVEGEGGRIEHSELTYGGGVVMVSGGRPESEVNGRPPRAVGGANTQNLFVYVDDIDAHFAQAVASGAVIVKPVSVSDYGEEHWSDRGYGARDCGDHHWWFAQRMRTAAKKP